MFTEIKRGTESVVRKQLLNWFSNFKKANYIIKKKTILGIKSSKDHLNSTLEARGRISELENISKETAQNIIQRQRDIEHDRKIKDKR